MARALAELGEPETRPAVEPRRVGATLWRSHASPRIAPEYRLGARVATREAFGAALEKLGREEPAIVALDGSLAPVRRLGITKLPRSGTSEELLEYCGISRHAIKQQVLEQPSVAGTDGPRRVSKLKDV